MMESFHIGAYWSARAESLNIVKNKVQHTLKALRNIDDQFLNWYETGTSRSNALERKLDLDDDSAIEKLCLEKVKKGELDESGIAKMGFLFSLWTGDQMEEESSSITFNVGKSSKRLNNSCVLKLPNLGVAKERLLGVEKSKRILSKLVEIWSPDYAVLTSHGLRDELEVGNKLGFITYQKEIRRQPRLSDHVKYEQMNGGHLFFIPVQKELSSVIKELEPIKKALPQ